MLNFKVGHVEPQLQHIDVFNLQPNTIEKNYAVIDR